MLSTCDEHFINSKYIINYMKTQMDEQNGHIFPRFVHQPKNMKKALSFKNKKKKLAALNLLIENITLYKHTNLIHINSFYFKLS